jgi:hypothetical protein
LPFGFGILRLDDAPPTFSFSKSVELCCLMLSSWSCCRGGFPCFVPSQAQKWAVGVQVGMFVTLIGTLSCIQEDQDKRRTGWFSWWITKFLGGDPTIRRQCSSKVGPQIVSPSLFSQVINNSIRLLWTFLALYLTSPTMSSITRATGCKTFQ